MRMTRKIISIMLAAVMMLSIMPFNGLTALFAFAESNGSSLSDGDVIEFGSYPQSKVTDSVLLAALDAAEKSWTSYGYYVGTSSIASSEESGVMDFGTMVQSDFMKYADITYNSEKYRAVKFTKYRPFLTTFKAEEEYTGTEAQYQNGYYINTVYYFKYEPLQWKVLDADEGLIMSCNVIDSQAYCNYIAEYNGEYYGDSSYTNYASSYAGSSLRSWLNNDFYNTAFSNEQQLQIKTTNLENLSTKSSAYDSAETNDKVFLLSYADVLNSEYGFNSDFSANDPARKLGSTDYAKCQGCYSSMEYENNSTCEKSYWWLRSPCTSYQAGEVVYDGFVDNCYPVYETDRGVVPAIKVTLEQETPSANKCGDNAFWSIENGTLTISGSGAIYDYEPGTHGPWNDSEDAYTSIVIESGITRIGEWAFAYSTATSVSIPDTVTSMGTAAFSGSALTSVTIPGSVETWQEAFVLCTSLQSVTIESGVEKIDVMSFGGCSSLQNVEIADTVSVIDSCAFQYCSSLEEITLADGVWMIAPDAFSGCSSLSAFAVSDNNPHWQVDDGVLFHFGSLFKYPAGKTDSFYRFPDDTNDVNTIAFEDCTSLTSIEFSNSVLAIGLGAFGGTENLRDVYFRGSETEWQNIVIEDDNYYLENAHKHYNYDPNALDKAMANVPKIKTYYSDESLEELNTVLEEIYQGTENMTPQQIEDLIARLNEALANLELKSYQVNVPENCTAMLSDVNGVNYKLATITAPQQNDAGEYFVYWVDNSGNIVSTYRTYSFYVGSSADYTPVYASAENYDAAKEDALITSRVIDVKNNGDGNLIFLAEHSVSSSKDLNGHGLLVTADEALSSDGALIRGTDSDSIFDFNAQKTKNSRTGMIQVNAAVTGATVWARTYVIDTDGEIHYGKIQSYNTAALSSADDDMIFVDSAELSVANEEPPVDEPADSDSGFVSNLMSFIMNIIQMISVLINSILSIIK